ncbi:MAG: universal stress protein [Candidatus Dormibacteria bacterium]
MFEKVLVAIDGSPYTEAALSAAEGLAAKAGCAVEVIHVHEHDFIPSKAGMAPDLERDDEAQALLDGAVARLKTQGVTVTGRLVQAQTRDVARAIIEAADDCGADMIIVGRRGLSSLTAMIVGSVSNKLIHVARVPIMVAHWSDPSDEVSSGNEARHQAELDNDVLSAQILEHGGPIRSI